MKYTRTLTCPCCSLQSKTWSHRQDTLMTTTIELCCADCYFPVHTRFVWHPILLVGIFKKSFKAWGSQISWTVAITFIRRIDCRHFQPSIHRLHSSQTPKLSLKTIGVSWCWMIEAQFEANLSIDSQRRRRPHPRRISTVHGIASCIGVGRSFV